MKQKGNLMKVVAAKKQDLNAWLSLAKEVEHLFGPMAGEESFQIALSNAIDAEQAFCIRQNDAMEDVSLCGGIVIIPSENEIGWLAVSEKCRGCGAGEMLLAYAIEHLSPCSPIKLVTFDNTVPEGLPARKLYEKFGFKDQEPMGDNPAGIPVALMVRPVE